MIEIKEAAKAWATLITALCAAVLAVGVDDTTGKILAIGVAVAGAVVTWAVGPPLATSALLPADPYVEGYDDAMARDEQESYLSPAPDERPDDERGYVSPVVLVACVVVVLLMLGLISTLGWI